MNIIWQSQNQASSTSAYDIYSQRYQNQANPNTAPTVTSPTSSNLTSTSATLIGEVTSDGGSSVTTTGYFCTHRPVRIQILKVGVLETTNVTGPASTGPYFEDISGLAPGIEYSYVAYATNGISTSYSAASTFTTPAALPTVQFLNSNTF